MIKFEVEAIVLDVTKKVLNDEESLLYITIFDKGSWLSQTKTLRFKMDNSFEYQPIEVGEFYTFEGNLDWGLYNGKQSVFATATSYR